MLLKNFGFRLLLIAVYEKNIVGEVLKTSLLLNNLKNCAKKKLFIFENRPPQ
jgi:hypothetical protein